MSGVVEVRSPAVGRVVEVRAAVGETVAAGQELAVVESMKVEIPVTAPAAGRVGALLVGPDDHVEEGDTLLTLVRGAEP